MGDVEPQEGAVHALLHVPRPWPLTLGLQNLKSEQTSLSTAGQLALCFLAQNEQEQPDLSPPGHADGNTIAFPRLTTRPRAWGFTRSLALLLAMNNPF